MKSITYWHPFLYKILMKLLFRGSYNSRYLEIANIIENNSSVIDVCCGDAKLYEFLKKKNIKYTGVDFSRTFYNFLKKKKIDIINMDIKNEKIPIKADYVVIQSSLYQFIPNHIDLVKKLLAVSKKYLIIQETVKSYTTSSNKLLSIIGKFLNNPGDGYKTERLDRKKLLNDLNRINNKIILKKEFNCYKDITVVIKK